MPNVKLEALLIYRDQLKSDSEFRQKNKDSYLERKYIYKFLKWNEQQVP